MEKQCFAEFGIAEIMRISKKKQTVGFQRFKEHGEEQAFEFKKRATGHLQQTSTIHFNSSAAVY